VAGVEALDFDSPDETRTPNKTRVDVIRVGETTAARMTFEPGWKWSECVKPVVGTTAARFGTWASLSPAGSTSHTRTEPRPRSGLATLT
jgi:hypothetical protein